MDTVNCDAPETRDLIARFVSGRLDDEAGLAELEAHLLECPRCRMEVRLAAAVRAELAAPARRGRSRSVAAATAAIAAVLVLSIGLYRWRSPERQLVRLGRLDLLPPYAGIPVRAPAAAGDSTYVRAMDAYSEGRIDEAAAGLAASLRAGTDSIPAAFFLGALRLHAGRGADAAALLRVVTADSGSAYAPTARVYLAKTLLLRGESGIALATLGDTPPEAALADSIVEILRR